MTTKSTRLLLLAGCIALSAAAQDVRPAGPPEVSKVSYALGMNLALQIKRMGADVDVKTIIQGLRDVREGKPTQLQPAELRPIFRQVEAARHAALMGSKFQSNITTNRVSLPGVVK